MSSALLRHSALRGRALLLGATLLGTTLGFAQQAGRAIGFEETFALATDRAAAIELHLVPGSPEAYYYRCLLAQHEGRLEDSAALLREWPARHVNAQDDPRHRVLSARQVLLRLAADPDGGADALSALFGLEFRHTRALNDVELALPARLDAHEVSAEAFMRRALASSNTVSELTERGLVRLAGRDLDATDRGRLLDRLARPDVPNLATLVVQDLGADTELRFGARGVHQHLLLEQLDECAAQRAELLLDEAFVRAYVRRLAPNPDERADAPEVRRAHLARLERFVARLGPAFHSLRAQILYHQLALDLDAGRADAARLTTYLWLPRGASYAAPEHQRGEPRVELTTDWGTGLPPITDDEGLVREALMLVLLEEDSFEPYVGPLRRDVVATLFADAKLLAGVPDRATGTSERWTAMLPPAHVEALRDRVDLDFARTQMDEFPLGGPVELRVHVKNVPELVVRVFEVDTLAHFAALAAAGQPLREVGAALDLDGLVPHSERVETYATPPMQRVQHTLRFDDLDRPGVYVIELLGNGKASRAVIRRGDLTSIERTGAAGHVFRVYDQDGAHAREASVLLGTRRFTADADGEIVVPFTATPGVQPVVLCNGDFGVFDTFQHQAEAYELQARIHVERELLLAGGVARLLVRPRLEVAGAQADLGLLEDVTLHLESVDLDGTRATSTVPGFRLDSTREAIHTLRVPPRLRLLSAQLTARVLVVTRGERVDLATAPVTFPVNTIDATDEIASALLTQTPAGFAVDVVGKNGEPLAARVVRVNCHHRDFVQPIMVPLAADASGRIELGALPGIGRVEVAGLGPDGFGFDLTLPVTGGLPSVLHLVAGTPLRVPFDVSSTEPGRAPFLLLERRGGEYAERTEPVTRIEGGYLQLDGLQAGDYSLHLPATDETYEVRVTAGTTRAGHAVQRDGVRVLELTDATPLTIAGLVVDGGSLFVSLDGVGPTTRVHVFASRFEPAFHPQRGGGSEGGPGPLGLVFPSARDPESRAFPRRPSVFEAGRVLSAEYRYILDRRRATKFPGNMLARAGLLLNPWVLEERTTTTTEMIGLGGGAGGAFGGRHGGARNLRRSGGANADTALGTRSSAFANLDFLDEAAVQLENLVPDAKGRVRVPLEALRGRHIVHVVAVDDTLTVTRRIVLPEAPRATRDVRFARGLDPTQHFVIDRRIEYVAPGERVTLADSANAEARTFDSLQTVFALFRTLCASTSVAASQLEQFRFLVEWPKLSRDEQRARHSEFACHEVDLFLRERDPAFFSEVVRPYLANKAHKEFMDRWLLDEDLKRYLEPWAFAELNVVERILLLRSRGEDAARHVREQVELLPADAFVPARYLDLLLASGGLEAPARKPGSAERLREHGDPSKPRAEWGAAKDTVEKAAEVVEQEEPITLDFEVVDHNESDTSEEFSVLDTRAKDMALRDSVRPLFRLLGETRELAERGYWRVRREARVAELVSPTPFWVDFAATPLGTPFTSTQFPLATRSLNEMLLALALLDLPFAASAHTVAAEDGALTLTAASGLYVVVQEVRQVAGGAATSPLLIGQDFFRLDEPKVSQGGRERDRFVTSGFVRGVPYGCRVVVTNPSATPTEVELLVEVPRGALPVRGFAPRKSVPMTLGSYASETYVYAFYFPAAGRYEHFPLHVAERGALVAHAAPMVFEVAELAAAVDTTSWDHVSQRADLAAVLARLKDANVHALDLARLAWRMHDRAAFDAVTALLRARQAFEPTLWSYAVFHRDRAAMREWLEQRSDLRERVGGRFESDFVTLDPVARRWAEHLEYVPLVNGRAHAFGGERVLLNMSFWAQYQRFLGQLALAPRLTTEDRMEATYYLFLQDRVGEALAMFDSIPAEQVASLEARLQHDFMRVHAAFYRADLALARSVAARYVEHPVERWRARFRTALAQLDEAEALVQSGDAGLAADRERQLEALASTEPALELAVEGTQVTLDYARLARCELCYRPMDLELLFSSSPFLEVSGGAFRALKAARTDDVVLPSDASRVLVDLPAEFVGHDVLVEARGGGVVRFAAHYSSTLAVRTLEAYGQVEVRSAATRALLPRAYVKVYARSADGTVRFHKDGYTDLRGRFDYVSRSGPELEAVERFALFIQHDDHGAEVRDVAPPAR